MSHKKKGLIPPPPPPLSISEEFVRPENINVPDYNSRNAPHSYISVPDIKKIGDALQSLGEFYEQMSPFNQTSLSMLRSVYERLVIRIEKYQGRSASDVKAEKYANKLILEVYKMITAEHPWSQEHVNNLGEKLEKHLKKEGLI